MNTPDQDSLMLQSVQNVAADSDKRAAVHKLLSDLLITIEDKNFDGQEVYVDGYRFINCRFVNCELWILRGTFEFHHCVFEGGIKMWAEDAQKCVQFYNFTRPAEATLTPKFYEDGSMSVAKGVTTP